MSPFISCTATGQVQELCRQRALLTVSSAGWVVCLPVSGSVRPTDRRLTVSALDQLSSVLLPQCPKLCLRAGARLGRAKDQPAAGVVIQQPGHPALPARRTCRTTRELAGHVNLAPTVYCGGGGSCPCGSSPLEDAPVPGSQSIPASEPMRCARRSCAVLRSPREPNRRPWQRVRRCSPAGGDPWHPQDSSLA